MPQPHLKKIISELPVEKKLIASGSLILAISLFLPWYQDIDSFHTGQSFTGLSGPLYLIGLTFMLMAIMSLAFIVLDYFKKTISFFNIKSSKLYFGFGIFSFYLLFVVNSVYFDHNFGVNIATKESQYGMFLAFIASALMTVGGYMTLRERKTILQEFEEETREKIVVMPKVEQQKPRENIRTIYPAIRKGDPVQEKTEQKLPSPSQKKPEKTPQPYRMDL